MSEDLIQTNEFRRLLSSCKSLALSFAPDIPIDEKNYQLHHFTLTETVTGYLLILELIQDEKDEIVTFCVPDIQSIEINSLTKMNKQQKLYLTCLVRPAFYDLQEIKEMKKRGLYVNEDKEIEAIQSSKMRYRMIVSS